MNSETSSIRFRLAGPEEIMPLRARELRSGKPFDSARFPEDSETDTLHFGAWHNNTVIGCLTLIANSGAEIPTWQLRGMATDKNWQKKGIGRALLHYAESYLREHYLMQKEYPEARVWCNARTGAVSFYREMGYQTISDEFMIEKIGPHYKMEKIIL